MNNIKIGIFWGDTRTKEVFRYEFVEYIILKK